MFTPIECPRYILSLTKYRYDHDLPLRDGLVYQVVFTKRIERKPGAAGKLVTCPVSAVLFTESLRGLTKLLKVRACKFVAPSSARPLFCFSQLCFRGLCN